MRTIDVHIIRPCLVPTYGADGVVVDWIWMPGEALTTSAEFVNISHVFNIYIFRYKSFRGKHASVGEWRLGRGGEGSMTDFRLANFRLSVLRQNK